MSRLSDPWALLFVAGALAANAAVTPTPRATEVDLREALHWIAVEWKSEETQRAFASDCEHPALSWYWTCDATE